jgi:hypothetical protein
MHLISRTTVLPLAILIVGLFSWANYVTAGGKEEASENKKMSKSGAAAPWSVFLENSNGNLIQMLGPRKGMATESGSWLPPGPRSI